MLDRLARPVIRQRNARNPGRGQAAERAKGPREDGVGGSGARREGHEQLQRQREDGEPGGETVASNRHGDGVYQTAFQRAR